MILERNPKDSHAHTYTHKKNLLELITEFSQVAGLQDTKSTYKDHLFLYTDLKLSEREVKKIPFTTASKTKCLGTNLIKEVKDLLKKPPKNYKTLMKKIEEDT